MYEHATTIAAAAVAVATAVIAGYAALDGHPFIGFCVLLVGSCTTAWMWIGPGPGSGAG